MTMTSVSDTTIYPQIKAIAFDKGMPIKSVIAAVFGPDVRHWRCKVSDDQIAAAKKKLRDLE